MYEYRADVLEVLEADCLRFKIDLGLDMSKEMISLLDDVTCPHRGQDGWRDALAVTQAWVWNRHGHVVVRTRRLPTTDQGRYRVVVLDAAGNSLGTALKAVCPSISVP